MIPEGQDPTVNNILLDGPWTLKPNSVTKMMQLLDRGTTWSYWVDGEHMQSVVKDAVARSWNDMELLG